MPIRRSLAAAIHDLRLNLRAGGAYRPLSVSGQQFPEARRYKMNTNFDPEQFQLPEARTGASGERIGHVNLRVADLNRAVKFYCEALGLKIVYYGPDIGIPTVFLAFGDYHHP